MQLQYMLHAGLNFNTHNYCTEFQHAAMLEKLNFCTLTLTSPNHGNCILCPPGGNKSDIIS